MVKTDFWEYWYYDDDLGQWVKDDDKYDFQWIVSVPIEDITDNYKENFAHNINKDKIIELAWIKINGLPTYENEVGKQDWMLTGIEIYKDDLSKITTVFYEANFDIYRETHLEFKIKNGDYEFVNLSYDIV